MMNVNPHHVAAIRAKHKECLKITTVMSPLPVIDGVKAPISRVISYNPNFTFIRPFIVINYVSSSKSKIFPFKPALSSR